VSETLVRVRDLTKRYRVYRTPWHRLLEWLTVGRVLTHENVWALRKVSFEVRRGECLGIVGPNGAGKTTLLKMLARVTYPTSGTFEITGHVVSLLELGTGFHPELSGVENVLNSARLVGLPEEYVRARLPAIIEFADIGEFIHRPLKTYSAGMSVRLAFSLFAHVEPDVYIVDEAFAVGDIFFQQKCFRKFSELKEKGAAILFVSHDAHAILRYCERVVILQRGELVYLGDPVDAMNRYFALGAEPVVARLPNGGEDSPRLRETVAGSPSERVEGVRRGNRLIEITEARFVDELGRPITHGVFGERVTLEIRAHAHADIDDLTFGFQITDRLNTVIFGQTAYMAVRKHFTARHGETFFAAFGLTLSVAEGVYSVAVFATDCQLELAGAIYDWLEGYLVLEVGRPTWREFHGVASLPTTVYLQSDERGELYGTRGAHGTT
jgi:lipopolysaccharide transport system ATP-binding protein